MEISGKAAIAICVTRINNAAGNERIWGQAKVAGKVKARFACQTNIRVLENRAVSGSVRQTCVRQQIESYLAD